MRRSSDRGAARRPPQPGAAAVRALVADPDPSSGRTLALHLEELGCLVELVDTGAAALAAAGRAVFDLVLSELALGEEDGLDLLSRLLVEAPETEVVIVTADVSCATAVEAIRRGASDYLRKPLSPEQLARLVEEARERAAAGRLSRRLHAMELEAPPLRERVEDILPLAQAFAAELARAAGRPVPALPLATRKLLVAWPWPGNARELREVIAEAMAASPDGELPPEALPPRLSSPPPGAPVPGGPYTVEEIEREHALRVLAWAGSLAEAARILGVSTDTIQRKRRKWLELGAASGCHGDHEI
ncbi:MAG TPA: response regulator [Anaeromyxobacteraceae bacterium]|jgi:DNA-binding NtrC family response regulator|nr:response regulator [Anaeromyxobacteraceae bacterium]